MASRVSILQIWTDLYHRYYNKLKNDLRLPLTNTVKELEEILDFGIQKLIKSEPGLILVNNDDEKHLMALMAMRINFYEEVVGSVQQRKQWFSLEKWENKAV